MRILILFLAVTICSIQDIKYHMIDIRILGAAILADIVIEITAMLCGVYSYNIIHIVKFVTPGIIPGLISLFLSKLVNGYGEGDAYVLITEGFFLGINLLIVSLAIAFVLSAVYAFCLVIFKKAKQDYVFPFVPFITSGVLVCLIVNGPV